MNPMVEMDSTEIKKFIYDRVLYHPGFRTVIAVSIEKYPSEYFATIWIGQEPDSEMRQYAYQLEAELGDRGVRCNIIIKSDRELAFGGTYKLTTNKGEFLYRYYKIDPVKDEDIVYVFAVYRGTDTYRVRLSLTGTLASTLRRRNQLNEEKVLAVYRDRVRQRLEEEALAAGKIEDVMFDSRDVSAFMAD